MPAPPVSRRSLLRAAGGGTLLTGGAIAAATLGGCDLDPRGPSRAATPAVDPDRSVVDAARAELSVLVSRLSATPGGAALAASHRRQLEALGGRPPARRGRRLTRRQVVARERRAAARFRRWALTCQNGDLARLLASVAAGIAMQPLPGEPVAGAAT